MSWKKIIHHYKLDADDKFWVADAEDISAAYNGCGPDNLLGLGKDISAEARFVFDRLTKRLRPAFVVHDWDFKYLEKTKKNLKKSNKRCLKNMMCISKKITKWYQPLRYWLYIKSFTVYRILKRYSEPAFFV